MYNTHMEKFTVIDQLAMVFIPSVIYIQCIAVRASVPPLGNFPVHQRMTEETHLARFHPFTPPHRFRHPPATPPRVQVTRRDSLGRHHNRYQHERHSPIRYTPDTARETEVDYYAQLA